MQINFADLELLLKSAFEETCILLLNNEKVEGYYLDEVNLCFLDYVGDDIANYPLKYFQTRLEDDCIKFVCIDASIQQIRNTLSLPEYDKLIIYKTKQLANKELISTLEFLKNK